MIAAAMLLAAQVAVPAPAPAPQHSVSLDWASMPPVPYRITPVVTPSMTAFVAREVAVGRCALPRSVNGHYSITVDVALLIAGDDTVKRAVPRAINCSTVEQYSAGLTTSFVTGNLLPRTTEADCWYRTSVTFDWQS